MQTFQTKLAAIATLTLVAACQPAAPSATQVDTGKIAETIKAGEVQWVADLAAKDAVKDASHYDDNATVMAPGAPLMRGKANIQAGMAQVMADPNFSLAFVPDSVGVSPSGDMAYTQGHFTESESDAKTHAKVTGAGSYVTVYKKEADGSWKAVEDIASAGPAAKS